MKLLLTSGGIRNETIQNTLVELLGKPISECNALCIPTAIYPFRGSPAMAYQFLSGTTSSPVCQLGWKSLGVLELSVLPSIKREHWVAAVQETDALLVWGGDPIFLRNWMRQSGLADLLPTLGDNLVYVGVSAGSMAVTAHIGEVYGPEDAPQGEDIQTHPVTLISPEAEPPTITFATTPGIGLVDFSLFPHLGNEKMLDTSPANVETWASLLPNPLYALDDQTALKVVDGTVEVISEGQWKLFQKEN